MSTVVQPIIDMQGVSFAYDNQLVLNKIDLQVEAGEFLGIVGPNAGGKSTLLKLILGLLKPLRGQIQILGKTPRQASRSIAYVPQYPAFPRDFPMTVQQCVLMGRLGIGSMLGWYSHIDHDVVTRVLCEVEADTLALRTLSSLSGGQLQRVLLARALACEPQILVLDEPTANIDQRLESDIFDLLKHLNKRLSILVVSHDVGFISSYVSRVACLNQTLICHHTDAIDGQVIQQLYGENVRMVAHQH
jgi:zinc transport system ATP-binding protein